MIPPDLQRGDLIMIEWWDAVEDPVGNPNIAKPAHRTSYSLYWDRKTDNDREYLVTSSTVDTDIPDQQGYAAYPIGMILKVTVVKKKRTPRKRTKKNETPPLTS